MADEESQKTDASEDAASLHPASAASSGSVRSEDGVVEFEGVAPANLGNAQYVLAAFFAIGVLAAFLIGKTLAATWNSLAETPAVYERVPFLLRYAEDERPTFTMVAGGIIAVAVTVWSYRKEGVRRWADEVASELTKVHWPDRETVTNGTIVVIVASIIATVYVGLLDRLWGFVTQLVYGA